MNNKFNKTSTMDENLEWFETNRSKLIADYPRKWIVISDKTIVKVGDDYQKMKEFREFYSKEDINCINVHCIDYSLFYSSDIEKCECFIGAANSVNNYDNIQTENNSTKTS